MGRNDRGLIETGWRLSYGGGKGRKEGMAAAAICRDRGGKETQRASSWLGKLATVADVERKAIRLVIKTEEGNDMLLILRTLRPLYAPSRICAREYPHDQA